jgi:hypothetical protein
MSGWLMRDYRSCVTAAVGYAIRQPTLLAMSAYLVISMLLTWPLLFKSSQLLFGDYGDSRGGAWWIWAKTNGLLDAPINNLIAAPFGIATERGFSQPIAENLLIMLARLFNEITAYNFFIFFAFPLTAIATYILVDKLLHNKIAAFVAGLVFGFCPAVVMQAAGGHAAFAFNVFIPLFLLALFYNRAQHTLLSSFYVAACFALILSNALYFGYFATYIAIFFLVFDMLNSEGGEKGAVFRSYLCCAVIAIILILPFEYQAIYQQLSWSDGTLTKAGHIRNFSELVIFSSRPWEFLIPSIDHPILGRSIYDFTLTHLHGSNIPEQTLYLGVVPIGLLLTGIILIVCRKFDVNHRTFFLFFAFGALWMYFLSLPPLFSIGSVNVPTVSYFAYYVAPMFRVYARFGILVNFFVACAASVVLTHLYQSMKRARYYMMLAVLLPMLTFEYWSVPPDYALAVDQPPEVYKWLAKEPKDIIVAEYPMTSSDESAFYTYLFWQRIHRKKLVNGASPDNARAWAFFEKVKDLSNPETPTLLQTVGVKYVIVHKKMYQEGLIPEPLKRYFPWPVSSVTYNGGNMPAIPFSMKLIKSFGADMVFSMDGNS